MTVVNGFLRMADRGFEAKLPGLKSALSIGVPPGYIVAFAAASYGYYIPPTHPSDLATIQFDRSGTTRIGKYVIDHSFILPGLTGEHVVPGRTGAGFGMRADPKGG